MELENKTNGLVPELRGVYFIQLSDDLIPDLDRPTCGLVQGSENIQQGRFSTTGRTNNRNSLSRGDL